MPRGKHTEDAPLSAKLSTAVAGSTLESVLGELKVLLETRRMEALTTADRLADILSSLSPKPRIGRPPKTTAKP